MPPAKRVRLTPSDFTCAICLDTPPFEDTVVLACAHCFCLSCWRAYAHTKLAGGTPTFACMHASCRTVLPDPALAVR